MSSTIRRRARAPASPSLRPGAASAHDRDRRPPGGMMPAMAGTLYLGTSGFGYDEWRHGVFYPEGLPASRMLSYYATLFRSVEINYTFRKFPSQKVLTSWLAADAGGVPVHPQGQSADHARATAARRGRRGARVHERGGRARRPAGTGAVPVPADRGVRRAVAGGVRRRAAAGDRGGDGVPPPQLACSLAVPGRAAASHAVLPTQTTRLPARTSWSGSRSGTCACDARPTATPSWRVWAGRIQAALDDGGDVYCYFKHEDSAAGPRMAQRLEQLMAGERDSRK